MLNRSSSRVGVGATNTFSVEINSASTSCKNVVILNTVWTILEEADGVKGVCSFVSTNNTTAVVEALKVGNANIRAAVTCEYDEDNGSGGTIHKQETFLNGNEMVVVSNPNVTVNGWYYDENVGNWQFYENYVAVSNVWKENKGKYYYLKSDTYMAKNMVIMEKVSENTTNYYYVGNDGAMKMGYLLRDNTGKALRYFSKESGKSVKNTEITIDGVTYEFDEDGIASVKSYGTSDDTTPHFEKGSSNKVYWYEDGVRQGTLDDSNGVMGDGTIRGREIYDPVSDGWYWLDAVYDGAKAVSKEVWMPYIYQDELNWGDDEINANAAESGDMAEQVKEVIKIHQNGGDANEGAGKWVRYDDDGKMYKGWLKITGDLAELYPSQSGNTYYYDLKTGLMAKGYVTIDGTQYHFDETTGARTN